MMECFTKLFLKSIQNAGTNSAMPVSYTHLSETTGKSPNNITTTHSLSILIPVILPFPVSYTHLDVYKRQPLYTEHKAESFLLLSPISLACPT